MIVKIGNAISDKKTQNRAVIISLCDNRENKCGALQYVQTISALAKPKDLAGPQKRENGIFSESGEGL